MAEDDIDRLLREVAAANNPIESKKTESSGPVAAPSTDVAPATSRSWVAPAGVAVGAGGAVTVAAFAIIPLIGSFGLLSQALAGALGGAVGYGVARLFGRRAR